VGAQLLFSAFGHHFDCALRCITATALGPAADVAVLRNAVTPRGKTLCPLGTKRALCETEDRLGFAMRQNRRSQRLRQVNSAGTASKARPLRLRQEREERALPVAPRLRS
jgi:hypothetical protein